MSRSVMVFSGAGCLLPFFLVFNLFFGWMLFKPHIWLGIEGVLILLFMFNAAFMARKLFSAVSNAGSQPGAKAQSRPSGDVIDVEGKIVRDQTSLPE